MYTVSKFFIEIFAYSNWYLNKYAKSIFNDIIVLGKNDKDTQIKLQNLKITDNEQFFILFCVVDFAIRLFNKSDILESEIYKKLKLYTLKTLCLKQHLLNRTEYKHNINDILEIEEDNTIKINDNFELTKNKDYNNKINAILKFLFNSSFEDATKLFQEFMVNNVVHFNNKKDVKIENDEQEYIYEPNLNKNDIDTDYIYYYNRSKNTIN